MANDKNKNHIINNWFYGSVGDRIVANRTSEVYQNSAKDIKNMIITDMGTLKIAKQFKESILSISGAVKKVLDTSDNVYIVLTDTNVYSVNKGNNDILHTVSHGLGSNVDMSLIGKDFFGVFDREGRSKFKIYNVSNLSQKEDYDFKNPIKDKKIMELDIWRVSKDPLNPEKKRIVKMSSATNPLLKVQDNNIYLHNSDLQIKRIYVNYNASVDVDYFHNPQEGDLYGIMRVHYNAEKGNDYIIDNTKVQLGELQNDSTYKGSYFTQITGGNANGVFSYGKLVDLSTPSYISFYQDRTIFYVDGYMYFSKIRDYFNFRNSVDQDSPFFVQLNPINNSIGKLLGMIASNGLYVLTTAGIYLVGYGSYLLTPSSISSGIIPITDMGVSDVYEVLDNTIYFINSNGVLKAIMLDRTSQQLSFTPHTVDKYSVRNLFKDITRIAIEDKDYILARGIDNKTMYLIESVNSTGIFRKVSLDFNFTGKVFGINDRFIMGDKVFSLGTNNYEKATVFINPPPLNNNNILMDNSSSINSVAIKLLNEDRKAVKGVKINGNNIQNLGDNVPDVYMIYKIKTHFKVKNGFPIEIYSNQNDKDCELQAIQMSCTAVEDM